ncbi:MAG: hypothetical protein HOM01_15135, partial [Kordiimonadaceae bacterium]|nr:hypothetical protein [Kordiimonadaceae bacterium]
MAEVNPVNKVGRNPGAHEKSIFITPADGSGRVDITALVGKIRISESIFQQALMAEFDIVDGVNLMEQLNITGNEKIEFNLGKRKHEGDDQISKYTTVWYVLDFPLYTRPKSDIQVYTIRTISPFGYSSKLTKMGDIQKGKTIDVLKEVYKRCGVEETNNGIGKLEVRDDATLGIMTFIPPQVNLSTAIKQVLDRTISVNGAPFFAYEVFGGDRYSKHMITSYNDILSSNIYGSYLQIFQSNKEIGTDERYKQERQRILSLSSELGFSPYKGYKEGAYISRTHIMDWTQRSYSYIDYNAGVDKPPMVDTDPVIHPNFKPAGIDMGSDSVLAVHNIYYNTNYLSRINEGEVNIHEHMPGFSGKKYAILSNMNQMTHTVKLYGDPGLSPGKTIIIQIPIAGYAAMEEKENVYDRVISGRYIIVSATHSFTQKGDYTTTVVLKKDSIDRGDIKYPEPKGLSGAEGEGFSSDDAPAGRKAQVEISGLDPVIKHESVPATTTFAATSVKGEKPYPSSSSINDTYKEEVKSIPSAWEAITVGIGAVAILDNAQKYFDRVGFDQPVKPIPINIGNTDEVVVSDNTFPAGSIAVDIRAEALQQVLDDAKEAVAFATSEHKDATEDLDTATTNSGIATTNFNTATTSFNTATDALNDANDDLDSANAASAQAVIDLTNANS